jgi:2-haloacid dehalogenase
LSLLAAIPASEGAAMPATPAAFVFDAYGTLFDVHSVAALGEQLAPGHGASLATLWRIKQLEYTWLGSLMERRHDFAQVTAEALDYAVAMLVIPLDASARRRLLDAYLALQPFPDVERALAALAPRPRWILSNGTLGMLEPLCERTGLDRHLDGVISVDDAGVYKPSPRVYRLASDKLALPPARIGFVSSNCWDAIGAKAVGFTAFWINRAGLPVDRHGPAPDYIVESLTEVASLANG